DNNGQTSLIIAARMGHSEVARLLANAGADIGVQDVTGKTSMHYAILNCLPIVDILIKHRQDVIHVPDQNQCTPLHLAARSGSAMHGHLATLKIITADILPTIGGIILVAASAAGQLLVVRYLLQVGIDPDSKDSKGQPALAQAAVYGYLHVVEALLQCTADPNIEDSDRLTPLHHAIISRQISVAEVLLDHCAMEQSNVDAPDRNRCTPLHHAATSANIPGIRLLLKHNSNLEARSVQRETPLHFSVHSPEAISILVEAGADLNARDSLMQTSLHIATQKGCVESVRMLISHGADIEAEDDEGRRPIYHAITRNDASMVKEMLHKGSNTQKIENVSFDDMKTAITSSTHQILVVLVSEREDSIRMTDKRGRTLLHYAVERPFQDATVRALLSAQAFVDAQDCYGRTPLLHAACRSDYEIMQLLLDHAADVNLVSSSGRTLLHFCSRLDIGVVRWLLANHADVNTRTGHLMTPLHYCSASSKPDTVRLLLDNDADPSIVDIDGDMPIHSALEEGQNECARELLDHPSVSTVDLNKANSLGMRPIHLAVQQCDTDVLHRLLEHDVD
ncbi:ankyrin, partial [Lophiostoma macrostomum CBS 122681]